MMADTQNINNSVLVLADGKSYLPIETVEFEGCVYLYLVDKTDLLNTRFVEYMDNKVAEIDPDLFTEKIFPLFVEKFTNRTN